MKGFIGLIVIIILGALGWYLFVGNAPAEDSSSMEDGSSMEMESEDESMMQDTEPLQSDSLAGTWRSVDDPKFVRNIYENGGYLDTYEGEPGASTTGPWVTFTEENAPSDFPYTLEAGAVYLRLDDSAGPLYFKITKLTDTELELIYLDRGGALRFTRVTE